MQPRLVSISYPSSPVDDGYEAQPSLRARDKLYATFHSRVSKRLRSLSDSWSDVRGQLRFRSSKKLDTDDQHSAHDLAPWTDTDTTRLGHNLYDPLNFPTNSKWQMLPQPLQANILERLQLCYSHFSSAITQQQWRNDLMSIQLVCRAWSGEAQRYLYENIQLKPRHRYDWSTSTPSERPMRILQLRQALRSNPRLAGLVKHLTLLQESQHQAIKDVSYADLIASVVMTCPKLETLTTFHVLYTHTFDRLFHALSTRTKLTNHTWVIGEDAIVQSRAGRRYRSGILSKQQTQLFLQHHAEWRDLETLNIISHNGKGVLEHDLFIKSLNMLPSLKHLYVSSFDANDFADETLLSLPPLVSLKLNNCPGVTEAGLCLWAESAAADGIEKLVFESQNITSLLTISALFDSLPALQMFHMVQLEFEPGLPLEFEVQQPLFKSDSLRTLEWHTASGQDNATFDLPGNTLPLNLREKAQTWPRSKSGQLFLSCILDFAFPHLHGIVLPGYDNLGGLLRWLRHSSWAHQFNKGPPLQRTSTPSRPAHHSYISNASKHYSVRMSLRPSSPSFDQYDNWHRTPSRLIPHSLVELPERNSMIQTLEPMVSASVTPSPTSPASPAPLPSSLRSSSTASRTNSDYHSETSYDSNSTRTSTSASTMSPLQQTFSASVITNVLHRKPKPTSESQGQQEQEHEEQNRNAHFTQMNHGHEDSQGYESPSNSDNDKRAENNHGNDDETSTSDTTSESNFTDTSSTSSRRSSISLLLDGYVAEAGYAEAIHMMSGALVEI